MELIYFILKPHGDKKSRRDSFQYTPNSSAFSSFNLYKANEWWSGHVICKWLLVSRTFIPLGARRLTVLMSMFYGLGPCMDELYFYRNKPYIDFKTDLIQLSPPSGGLCCPHRNIAFEFHLLVTVLN